MSTSTADGATINATPEPLKSLFDAIDQARELPAPMPHTSPEGDPIEALRRTMRGEDVTDAPEAAPQEAAAGASVAGEGAAGSAARSAASGASGADEQVASTVGREILRLLETRPLAGAARAEAVAKLSAQISQPDPEALRDILAILLGNHHA